MRKNDMSENRESLLEKQRELEERLQRIKNDFASGLEADSEERATQLENHDVLLEIQRVSEEELARVKKELAASD